MKTSEKTIFQKSTVLSLIKWSTPETQQLFCFYGIQWNLDLTKCQGTREIGLSCWGFGILCSSRKNPCPPHGRSSEIPRGRRFLKVNTLEAKYEAKLEFPVGTWGAKQKTFRGGSMDIFWNCTLRFLSIYFKRPGWRISFVIPRTSVNGLNPGVMSYIRKLWSSRWV